MHELRGDFVFVPFELPLQLIIGSPVHAFGWKWIIKIAIAARMLAKLAGLFRRLIPGVLILTGIGKVLAISEAEVGTSIEN
tara:strand:- start:10978 stop:11220 length:243 start_codon:yes stop_codon:yes gene_type:complete